MSFDPTEDSHRRYNPLMDEWVIVSAQRLKRPWRGQTEKPERQQLPEYDPTCYLCPSNTRAGGVINEDYESTFVFRNDYAVLMHEPNSPPEDSHPLFKSEKAQGECRVLCFSPRHDLTLAEMDEAGIKSVIGAWQAQTAELSQTYQWVQLFENKGAMMGCSNPHPHGQLWGQPNLPTKVTKEDQMQRAYFEAHQRPLLLDYATEEAERGERVIAQNDDWLAVVPYWAAWPFEALLLPRHHIRHITALTDQQADNLASAMKEMLVKFDNLFETSFPYSMGWHGAPFNGETNNHWQLHAHFYPPLLRSATVRKFMVGYEMLGELQRDLTAEQAAARLRALPSTHYTLEE